MFNEILEGGFNQVITQRLGMKGGAAAPAVAPEVFPTMALEVDRPEWGWLKGEAIIGHFTFVAAAVGVRSALQLYVPGDRDIICTVQNISCITTDAVRIERAIGIGGTVGPWTPEVTNPRDFRYPPQGAGTLLETIQDTPSGNGLIAVLNNVQPTFTDPIVITPNTSLLVMTENLNTALSVSIQWRERVALPGELV
jgi:hypothetical protein